MGRKPHSDPWHWAKARGGAMSPQSLPGVGGAFGGGRPSNLGSTIGIPGMDPFYKDPATDPMPGTEGIGLSGLSRQYAYEHGKPGAPTWAEGWYKPYYEGMVAAPMRQIMGMPGQRGSQPLGSKISEKIKTEKSEFMPISEVSGVAPELYEGITPGSATTEVGYTEPIIAKEAETDLRVAGTGLGVAESEYQRLTGPEGVYAVAEQEEEALKKEKLGDVTAERIQAARGREGSMDLAKAPQATSGMAYSAPAEQATELKQLEDVKTGLDFKTQERDIVKDYKTNMADIEEERRAAETAWLGDQMEFQGTLASIFGDTKTRAEEIGRMGGGILTAHSDYGQQIASKSRPQNIFGMTKYGGTGASPEGFWGEGTGGTYESELLTQLGEEGMGYAERLEEQAISMMEGFEADISDLAGGGD